MKKILSLLAILLVVLTTNAQNPFFDVVNYRGAFAPAPATPWTEGWTNWDPQHVVYPSVTDTITGSITANTTWISGKTYLISGLVYVKGATLTIQPGTIIRGDATVANSSLVITKGAKINAVGTSSNPIVFTSSKDTASRAKGDWGGIIILGKSTVNKTGGVGNIEGIATSSDTEYGGGASPDDNDNSGNLKYVRIEYGGYIFATDQEINGLTMGGVGRNTVIDYVQCSYINDDAFEWFGGTVNCSHLVAYKCLDDNFDTDNGFSGSVQFCLGVRDPLISDQSSGSTSEGFESDNDAGGSTNTPQTTCVFSNVTDISGFFGTVTNPYASTFKFRRGARIRRNSGIKILNSILMDAPYGVFIDGAACRANLQTGVTVFKNNIVAGNVQAVDPSTTGYSTVKDSLFTASKFANDSSVATTGILANPYDTLQNFTADYRPASSSLALSNVNFTDAAFNNRKIVITSSSFIKEVTYRGAFAPSPSTMWTDGWTNWDPKHTEYPAPTVTVSGNITSNTTWTANNTYLISGLVYVASGVTLTIKPGTVIRGDATVSNSSLIITKNAKLNAIGTVDSAIVFTSSKDTASRNIGDWGGVILLGRASYNGVGGVSNIEGIAASTSTEFGGGATPNDDDNSGTLKYVRIEYGGYIFATDKEINGLTMGAVGRGTTIDYVQCSFINDDAFEWFGGSVNCSHLVAYRCLDDNFDTDNGFSGSVQFGLGVRDPLISDQSSGSTSEGFESDNDAGGSSNLPQTKALFTNITDISGFRGTSFSTIPSTFKFRRSARIRRNSGLKVFNSILMDAPYGVFIDGTACRANLQTGVTKFKNNLIAGSLFAVDPTTSGYATVKDSLFGSGTGLFKNDSLSTTSGVLVTPYDFYTPDYRPTIGGLGTLNAAFTDAAFNGLIAPCDDVNAPGLMSGASNISGCSNPQTYSIPAIANASSYYWSVPAGVTFTGQGTRTIIVSFPSTLTATWTGTITVVGKNDCGNSSVAATKTITKVTLGTPGTIAAPTAYATNVCTLVAKDTAITYSITAVAGATNYAWTKPAYTTIVTGQGTPTITLKFLAGYTTAIAGDTLRLVVTSSCSTAVEKKLAIKAALPTAPAGILNGTGGTAITAVCTYVGTGTKVRYTIKKVASATSYSWYFKSGTNTTITPVVGVDTAVDVTYLAGYNSDSLFVKSVAGCGLSTAKGIKPLVTLPTAPAGILSATGGTANVVVCTNVGTTVRYAVKKVATAISYNWYFKSGIYATITPVVGVDTAVDIAYLTGYTSDSLFVKAVAACGSSLAKGIKPVATLPATPAGILSATGGTANIAVCASVGTGTPVRYTVKKVATAISYNWYFKSGTYATISAVAGVDTAVDVTYLAGYTSDSLLVKSIAACGSSLTAKGIKPATTLPTAPAGILNATGGSAVVAICSTYVGTGTPVRYTVKKVATATSYNWYFKSGAFATIAPVAGVDTAIDVTYLIGYTSDSLFVKSVAGCGSSAAKGIKPAASTTCPLIVKGSNNNVSTEKTLLYPNPNNGVFTLNVTTGKFENTKATIQVVDMMGKVVYQTNAVVNNGILNSRINNYNLSNGIYTVRYTIGSVSNTVKMVVQK